MGTKVLRPSIRMRRGVARVTGKSRSEPIVSARFSRLRGRFHGSLDGAREDFTWIRGDDPVARDYRDYHGWEALLLGG